MTTELQDKLTEIFPWFHNIYIECGDGWQWIILDMCREIDDLYFDAGREVDIEIVQIKEKFGSLRVYYSHTEFNGVFFIDEIIAKYELLSKKTCEFCGKDASIINEKGWLRCVCKNCERIW